MTSRDLEGQVVIVTPSSLTEQQSLANAR